MINFINLVFDNNYVSFRLFGQVYTEIEFVGSRFNSSVLIFSTVVGSKVFYITPNFR